MGYPGPYGPWFFLCQINLVEEEVGVPEGDPVGWEMGRVVRWIFSGKCFDFISGNFFIEFFPGVHQNFLLRSKKIPEIVLKIFFLKCHLGLRPRSR
jgi:hypothetical protein